jgi:hypothetical protein
MKHWLGLRHVQEEAYLALFRLRPRSIDDDVAEIMLSSTVTGRSAMFGSSTVIRVQSLCFSSPISTPKQKKTLACPMTMIGSRPDASRAGNPGVLTQADCMMSVSRALIGGSGKVAPKQSSQRMQRRAQQRQLPPIERRCKQPDSLYRFCTSGTHQQCSCVRAAVWTVP